MRIQNFGSWSPYMVKDGRNVLGLEYTVWEGDDEWNAPDEELIERAKRELEQLGLVDGRRRSRPATSCASARRTRSTTSATATTSTCCGAGSTRTRRNVHPVGRNGMFRYNNQDHSMFTAMLTVENISTGTDHDVWEVNVEEEYHEETAAEPSRPRLAAPGSHGTGRDAPVLPRAGHRRQPAGRTPERSRSRCRRRAAPVAGRRSGRARPAASAGQRVTAAGRGDDQQRHHRHLEPRVAEEDAAARRPWPARCSTTRSRHRVAGSRPAGPARPGPTTPTTQ